MCKSMDKGAMWPFGEISPKLGTNRTLESVDGVPTPGTQLIIMAFTAGSRPLVERRLCSILRCTCPNSGVPFP